MSAANEARLLRRALDGELPRLLDLGLSPALLGPPFDEAFRRLIGHYAKYQGLPSVQTAKEMFDGLGPVVAPAKESVDKAEVYWDRVLEERLEDALITKFEELERRRSSGSLSGKKLLEAVINEMHLLSDRYSPIGSLSSTPEGAGRELKEDYELTKSGKIPGAPIHPAFPGLVEALICLRPAHITTIIARSKVGKTWLALFLCLHAAQNGYRCLISSMEMIKEDIIRRLVCMVGGLNFDNALHGRLIPEQEEVYFSLLSSVDSMESFWENLRFMNPAEIQDIDSVERQASKFDAHLVLADAFYDFPARGNFDEDWKRIRHNLRIVRQVSLVTRRHWLLTAQFTKSAKNIRKSDDFSVGGTDALNYVSNSTIYLIQSEADRDRRQVVVKVGRAREAKADLPWRNNWDFMAMNVKPIVKFNPAARMGVGR